MGVSAWSWGGVVRGGLPGPRGVSAWSRGVCLVLRGGVCLVLGGGCVVLGGSAWSQGGLPGTGGVSAWSWGGGGCVVLGGSAWSGGSGIPACTKADTLPPRCGQADTCKNITLATTSLRPVNIKIAKFDYFYFKVNELHLHSQLVSNLQLHAKNFC